MRVLTLREPWASLIAARIKTVETRSWKTNYRGELYIHTGLGKSEIPKEVESDFEKLVSMPGHIIAKCKLTDCIYMDEEYLAEIKKGDIKNYVCGDYEIGRYAWILEDVEYIEPIKAIGKLGLWKYYPEEK